jgi:hypothetical protein
MDPFTKRRIAKRQRCHFKERAEQNRAWRDRRDGSQGAAGPCKRIDPVTGETVEVLPRR